MIRITLKRTGRPGKPFSLKPMTHRNRANSSLSSPRSREGRWRMSSAEHHSWLRWMGGLVLVLALSQAFPVPGQQPTTPPPQVQPQPNSSPLYGKPLLLGEGPEWRAYPVLVDINGDGHLDIAATHRTPVEYNSLHIWLGTG